MDRAPEGTVGVVLVKQMVLALPKKRPVGIVHPIRWRDEVVKWPMPVAGESEA
jgi:hypothetical protein